MDFENIPEIGKGSFTATEIADILNVKYHHIHRWINIYWDGKLSKEYGEKYSWVTDGKRAVSFHTFVEFYVMMQFSEAGVKPREVMKAHTELSELYNTAFPFALQHVLENIHTDKRKIYFDKDGSTLTLDGSKQFNLKLIQDFCVKLEFNNENLASKYYPLGKKKSIVIDPERKFGQPVFKTHNTFPDIIYDHYQAGESIEYIAAIYELNKAEVRDAIQYKSRRAA
ncbi:DUF433 domain-containing protein [Leeuwenhoekiella blandensis]|uniref:DUF433 domain-containing protein n=1 Tax=Leeuwenhoekiella blandensis (strain CECT 7118 / CCUG 51940 / KCTC 22103 / MED217) TaxID=398720 RepID=A3XPU5_LEEBM|nr:DUF433 domain-containing protein [Leeuwenhoekiella blandensis]EAQ48426.1 hypothetical protein MED217_13004 [Leeuwenhoekiella blandensis MED217]